MRGNGIGRYGRENVRYRGNRNVSRRRPVTRRPSGDASHLLRLAAAAVVLTVAIGAVGNLVPGAHWNWAVGPSFDKSTPISEWRKGEVPMLLQTDPAWADEPYAGGTVAENGCGPTCLTMAYICLTGNKDYDPALMCKFSESNGHVDSGKTSWTLMSDGVQMLGLKSEELPADVSALRSALDAGHPVILSMGPGDFTTTGHFIVAVAIDDRDRLTVRDPNSPKRSVQEWDASQVLRQCLNLWAISR